MTASVGTTTTEIHEPADTINRTDSTAVMATMGLTTTRTATSIDTTAAALGTFAD